MADDWLVVGVCWQNRTADVDDTGFNMYFSQVVYNHLQGLGFRAGAGAGVCVCVCVYVYIYIYIYIYIRV